MEAALEREGQGANAGEDGGLVHVVDDSDSGSKRLRSLSHILVYQQVDVINREEASAYALSDCALQPVSQANFLDSLHPAFPRLTFYLFLCLLYRQHTRTHTLLH